MRNVFAGALAALSILTSGQAAAKEILYIHNTYSGVVSKISIPEHEVLGEIEIGYYMDYLAASPDGKILYVNRIDGDLPGARARNVGVSGELIAVSTRTDEILWRVTLDGMPHHMSVSPDGRRVYSGSDDRTDGACMCPITTPGGSWWWIRRRRKSSRRSGSGTAATAQS